MIYFKNAGEHFLIAVVLYLLTALARLAIVPVLTSKVLNRKEQVFIGLTASRGLTTAVLALIAFSELTSHGAGEKAAIILNVSIFVILLSAAFHTAFTKLIAAKTDVLESSDPLEDLFPQLLVVELSAE